MFSLPSRDPFRSQSQRDSSSNMGMVIFLIVVAIVFVTTILGYIVVRLNPDPAHPWRDDSTPGLPITLVFSTLVLLASSETLHQSLLSARRGDVARCARFASITYWLGVGFVLLQGEAWWSMWRDHVYIDDSLYAWTFYVLTALHVLHILGGLFSLGVVARRAREGRYDHERHNGIVLASMYWHTLDAIWIVLYATLWFGAR